MIILHRQKDQLDYEPNAYIAQIFHSNSTLRTLRNAYLVVFGCFLTIALTERRPAFGGHRIRSVEIAT